jgi:hypothetical protein
MVDELGFTPSEPPARRRRRAWPWLVVLAIVVVLVAGAAVAAEAIARGLVTTGVRTLIASQVDSTGEIDVDVPGLVIPQLLSGTLDQVDVSADDVSIGGLTGDVSVTALGVPISGDAAARGGTATVRLDVAEVRALLSRIDGFPAEDVGLQSPDVTFSTEFSVFGIAVPVGVSLVPGAADGALTLTPASFEAAGGTVDAEQLRQQLGGLADGVIRDWSICIEDQLPSALTLTGVTVDASNELVATFDVNGAVVVDRSLLQPGSCG